MGRTLCLRRKSHSNIIDNLSMWSMGSFDRIVNSQAFSQPVMNCGESTSKFRQFSSKSLVVPLSDLSSFDSERMGCLNT